jgi:proline iminopeptidase
MGWFRAGVPEADRDGDLVAAYDRLLNAHRILRCACRRPGLGGGGCDPVAEEVRLAAPGGRRAFICLARLVTHYFSHAAWPG